MNISPSGWIRISNIKNIKLFVDKKTNCDFEYTS